jgi:hypothetical protein
MMMQGLICIIPFSKWMHAPVFIGSFSRNDKYHSFSRNDKLASFHFLNHFKNNILLFVLTRKRVPSFRENHFLMGTGRPAAVPFPASSSLTPHHLLCSIDGSIVGIRRVS